MQHIQSSRDDMSTRVHKSPFKHLVITEDDIILQYWDGHTYEISLSDCRTCQEICQWLGQIEEKSWSSVEMLGELVQAFTQVNGDLRGID
jgi:hypothetical protein